MPVAQQEKSQGEPFSRPECSLRKASPRKFSLPALLVILLASGVSLWKLGQVPLYDTEAFYAEVGREMLESKDWITPRFDYDRFLDKPPLYYWFLVPAYKIFGTTEAVARLPAALALTSCVALTVLAGSLLFGGTTAWLAGLFVTTTMGFYVYSHAVLVEPLLTFWITASLVSFWDFYRDESRKKSLWMIYTCLALGFLTKGITAVLFPVTVMASFLVLTGGWNNLKPLFFWKGWILLLCLILPWHLWIAGHHPGYLWFYFIHEQFLRFLDMRTIKDAPHPTYVFLGVLIPLIFPWSFFLPQSIQFYSREWRQERALHQSSLFVLLWAGVVIAFFSLSKFKLDYYSLPAYPPIMLAIAHSLSARMKQPGSRLAFSIPVAIIFILSATGLLVVAHIVKAFDIKLPDPWFLRATEKALALLLISSLAAGFFLLKDGFKPALLCLAGAMLPIMALAQQGMLLLGPDLSHKELAQIADRCIGSLPSPATLVESETVEDIYVGGDVFYTKRRVWLVKPREKQVFPLGRRFYLTPQELASWWRRGKPILFINDLEKAKNFPGADTSYFLTKSGEKVLISNQPICGARKGLHEA